MKIETEFSFFCVGTCYVREGSSRNALQSFLREVRDLDTIQADLWKVHISSDSDGCVEVSLQEGIHICLKRMFWEDILDEREDFFPFYKVFFKKVGPIFTSQTNLEASAKAKAAKDYFIDTMRPEILEKRRSFHFTRLFLIYWDIIFDVLDLFILQEE